LSRILIISNGHGEDLSGSLLGKSLISLGHKIDAFPLVGIGKAYKNESIRTLGLQKEFSTGGMGYITLIGRLTELLEGQIIYLFRSIIIAIKASNKYDLILSVGDVLPAFVAWLSRKPSVVYLVAYSSHYEGKLKLPWPCKNILLNKRFLSIFSRDQLTAEDLTEQLNKRVLFYGNPFMDSVLTEKDPLVKVEFRLGILPGSRRPELDRNIIMIIKVLGLLPQKIFVRNISIDMALVNSMDNYSLINLFIEQGWQHNKDFKEENLIQFIKGLCIINIRYNSFDQIIQNSNILLGMAGTAIEQAVGFAKPIIQLPGEGPQFTYSFAEAQRRLLGPTLFCVKPTRSKLDICQRTAELIYDLSIRINNDKSIINECNKQAFLRLGKAGGTKRISQYINNLLENIT